MKNCQFIDLLEAVQAESKSVSRLGGWPAAYPSAEINCSHVQPAQAKMLRHCFKAMVTLALMTDMRRGEILALRWSDIDFETKNLEGVS